MPKLDPRLKKYRAAIKQEFPQLVIENIEYLSEGWDSIACLVNGDLLFRFPKRREVATQLLHKEIPLLATLAPVLPLPIPNFEYVATEPASKKIWPFAGYKLLPGKQLEECSEEVLQEGWWKPITATFLKVLHNFPVAEARRLGVTDMRMVFSRLPQPEGDWREALEQLYTAARHEIFPLLADEEQDKIADQFEAFLDDDRYFQFEPVLIHGDFSTEHVLLNVPEKKVTGIIDFGDAAIGDPAYDLWENLLPYYDYVGDETFVERCRFYKKLPPLHSILWGQRQGDPALIEYGLYELRRLWL